MMIRAIQICVALVVTVALILAPVSSAFAGVKDGQRGSVTIEKSPQAMPGVARQVLPAGNGGPIKGFPKWTAQYFDSSIFFFWLNFGYYLYYD